ncbi:MAG: ribosome biogenesis GTPase YlqF [Planctomycetota bacterium]
MPINWFPGHMHKTRQQLAAMMSQTDVVVEVLDARLPDSSRNPLLDELRRGVQGKGENGTPGDVPCITLLNKHDLADPAVTRAWRDVFEEERGVKTLTLIATKPGAVKDLPKMIRRFAKQRVKKDQKVRVMVVGIPNAGKSTIINALRGKKVANVGDEPAVTRGKQEIVLKPAGGGAGGIVLVDTPGILWPKFEDPLVGYRLAVSGAIKDTAIDYDDVAVFAARWLLAEYPAALKERYKLATLPDEPVALLEAIGKKRGCLVGGGEVDLNRAGELLLREMRGGKLGRISIEKPAPEVRADGESGGGETGG